MSLVAYAYHAAELLQVAEQLAEAGRTSRPPSRAAVPPQVEQIGRVPGGAQPLAGLAPAPRVVEPAVQRQDGGARRGGLVGVVDQLSTVGGGERRHSERAALGLGQHAPQQIERRLRGAAPAFG